MASKNKAGATFYNFQSRCGKILEAIDRKSRRFVADFCTSCGQAHAILTMTEDGYQCDGCLQAPTKVGLVEINDLGKLWSF